jgi:hypothetical protein
MVVDQATGPGRCQKRSTRLHRGRERKRYPREEIVRLRTPSLVELVWSIEMCLPRGQRGSGAGLQQALWGRSVP